MASRFANEAMEVLELGDFFCSTIGFQSILPSIHFKSCCLNNSSEPLNFRFCFRWVGLLGCIIKNGVCVISFPSGFRYFVMVFTKAGGSGTCSSTSRQMTASKVSSGMSSWLAAMVIFCVYWLKSFSAKVLEYPGSSK